VLGDDVSAEETASSDKEFLTAEKLLPFGIYRRMEVVHGYNFANICGVGVGLQVSSVQISDMPA
jgi:hypothetical protein